MALYTKERLYSKLKITPHFFKKIRPTANGKTWDTESGLPHDLYDEDEVRRKWDEYKENNFIRASVSPK